MTTSKIIIPKAQDWDHFWSLEKTQKFTKVSWSKRRIIQILEPYAQKNKKVLDAGCGSGFFTKYFYDKGMESYALDYSQEALNLTRGLTHNQVGVYQKDLRSPQLLHEIKERFDVIFSDGLLEHFPLDEQKAIIGNFVALLNKGGALITFVPNRFSPWELIRPFFMPGIEETPFTLNQLVRLNAREDLALIQKGGVNTFPFRFSPDKIVGHLFGMLLFTIAIKR